MEPSRTERMELQRQADARDGRADSARHARLILSAQQTKRVAQFLGEHSNVHLHFTPTYSSWLNQVELWFAKIERDVIARGVFTSVPDLKRKLMRYIRQYSRQPKPVKWKYFDFSRRITSTSTVTAR